MNKSRRLSSRTPAEGGAASDQRARKKGHSALIQRAALFTALVFLAAVIVGSPVYHLANRLGVGSGRLTVNEKLDHLTVFAENTPFSPEVYDAFMGGLFANDDDLVIISHDSAAENMHIVHSDSAVDNSTMLKVICADGVEECILVRGGAEQIIARRPADASLEYTSRYVLQVNQPARGHASLIGLMAGFIAACLAALPLSRWILMKSVREIGGLRDVAVKVAGGDFDAHADEGAPDELGELGKALNNLSYQLSRNMYMLIVERNRLKNMLNGLSEGIIAIDGDGAITHINPGIEAMFEQKKISVGLPDARMKHVPDKTVWEDFDSVIKTGEAVTRNINSRDMIIRMTITPIVDEIGSIAGAVGLFSDITQMERLERTRREYVSNVSHELRTPLTAVRALVEPLKEGMVTREEDRMRYYDIILREVMRLSRLINDQLELSRLQSGGVAISKQRMTLDDLIYDVCDRYHSIAEENGLQLNIESDLENCPSVYGNPDRVEQMFIILLDNAIKYTEEGSVNVKVDWDDELVRITVRDTGIGIAEEDLPYVFDRFYKVDKAHSGKGSGLGLSIARELLNRMDEQIWVESKKGEGSSFTFTVHRNPPAEEA